MFTAKLFKKLLMLISVNLTIILIFAGIYYSMKNQFNGMDEDSTFSDCFYFSCTTFSSVGYGDISPATDSAKITVIIQQFFVIIGIASMIFTESSGISIPNISRISTSQLHDYNNDNIGTMGLSSTISTTELSPTVSNVKVLPMSTSKPTYTNPLINNSNSVIPSPALQQANYMNTNRGSDNIPILLKYIK